MIIITFDWRKIEKIVREIYRGSKVSFREKAQTQIHLRIVKSGSGQALICMAKTQYSFSTEEQSCCSWSTRKFRNYHSWIWYQNLGQSFIVALTGDVMTMPGLPTSRHSIWMWQLTAQQVMALILVLKRLFTRAFWYNSGNTRIDYGVNIRLANPLRRCDFACYLFALCKRKYCHHFLNMKYRPWGICN